MKDILKSDLSKQEFDSLENINFYSFYNVQDGSIELVATYWFMKADGLGVTETHGDAGITLKEHEIRDLLASMEQYCHRRYGMSTLSFVNEARTHEGLCALERHCTDLDLPDRVDAWIKGPLDQMFEDYPVSERSACNGGIEQYFFNGYHEERSSFTDNDVELYDIDVQKEEFKEIVQFAKDFFPERVDENMALSRACDVFQALIFEADAEVSEMITCDEDEYIMDEETGELVDNPDYFEPYEEFYCEDIIHGDDGFDEIFYIRIVKCSHSLTGHATKQQQHTFSARLPYNRALFCCPKFKPSEAGMITYPLRQRNHNFIDPKRP